MSTHPNEADPSKDILRSNASATKADDGPTVAVDPATKNVDDGRAALRRMIYFLLITLGTGAMLGRILAVDAVDQTAIETYRLQKELATKAKKFRAMGLEGGRFVTAMQRERERFDERLPKLRRPFLSGNDRSRWCTVRVLVEEDLRVEGFPYAIDKVQDLRGWDTIDMVKHDEHLFSSKPPLLPTLMAAEYWVIHRITGMSFATHPFTLVRLMLMTINVIPLLIYFVLLARLIERWGTSDWGRLFVMAAAVFGTFLTTFAVVVNNHLPAAVCAMIAIYATVRIWFDGERRWRYFLVAGLFGAFTAANELPALSFFGLLSLLLLWKAPRRTLVAYVPASLVVAAAFFGTNWIAHANLKPAYMHRSEGDNWYDYTYERGGKPLESYWRHPVGIDRGEPSACFYAVHLLVGHHGIISLTPIWLLSAAGGAIWLTGRRGARFRELALLVGIATCACLAFYLTRPEHYRNYGGVTSGLRWMFWFAPLWLLMMLPAADAMASRRWTRGIALLLLAASVLSVSYPVWNPWTNPWIMDYFYHRWWI